MPKLGAGRKPKDIGARALTNARVGSAPIAPRAGADPKGNGQQGEVSRPGDLSAEERKVWDATAPHAIAAGTLTESTAAAFRELISAIVAREEMASAIAHDGRVIEGKHGKQAHPLLNHERQMRIRVEAGRTRFRLLPIGKSMVELEMPSTPESPFEQLQKRTAKLRLVKP